MSGHACCHTSEAEVVVFYAFAQVLELFSQVRQFRYVSVITPNVSTTKSLWTKRMLSVFIWQPLHILYCFIGFFSATVEIAIGVVGISDNTTAISQINLRNKVNVEAAEGNPPELINVNPVSACFLLPSDFLCLCCLDLSNEINETVETFPADRRVKRGEVELWIGVKCGRPWQLGNLAPVVLCKIKTFRGANELFSSAFVSSFNQSPQVTVSVATYAAAALSLQKAQIRGA